MRDNLRALRILVRPAGPSASCAGGRDGEDLMPAIAVAGPPPGPAGRGYCAASSAGWKSPNRA